jgi:hypothetical protein
LRFVNEVGFCTAFSYYEHLPCLWVAICGTAWPRYPTHTHSDQALGLTWELKDQLPDQRQVFYAKVLHRKPSLISLEYLPYFYKICGPEAGRIADRKLSSDEQGIVDWLATRPPQTTFELRMQGGFHGARGKARFEKVLARLQERFYIVKTQTLYEPAFTYVWGPFDKTFPEAVRVSRSISSLTACVRIASKYFQTVLCAKCGDLDSMLPKVGYPPIKGAMDDLVEQKFVLPDVCIQGAEGKWFILNPHRAPRVYSEQQERLPIISERAFG